MKKACFLDLTSVTSDNLEGVLYVFNDSSSTYEFERSFEYAGKGTPPFAAADFSDFALGLPLEVLNFRVMKLPFDDREKLLKVVPFELETLIMERSGEVVFDVVVLGGSGDSFDVLVTYMANAALKQILGDLAASGIDPGTVTSLELRPMLKGGAEDLALRLVNPERLKPDERIEAAANELRGSAINLRTGPFAYMKDVEKTRKTLGVTVGLLMLLALLINAYLAFGIITSRSEASGLRKELRNTYSALFPGDRTITDELYQMKSRMREIKEKGDALMGVHPLQVLLDLSQKMSPSVAFNEVALDRDIITLKGEASSMEDVDRAKARLSDILKDVSVSDIKPSVGAKTLFTIVAKGRK